MYIDQIGMLDLAGLKAAYGSQERFLQYLVCQPNPTLTLTLTLTRSASA